MYKKGFFNIYLLGIVAVILLSGLAAVIIWNDSAVEVPQNSNTIPLEKNTPVEAGYEHTRPKSALDTEKNPPKIPNTPITQPDASVMPPCLTPASTNCRKVGLPPTAKDDDYTINFHATREETQGAPINTNEPPLKLKGIGVNFEDFKFTKERLQFGRIFMGFGFVIPGNSSSSGQAKSNPQPTYVVPLGTPVRSIVDGIVVAIPTLWSGDVSIQVTADGKMQKWIYETEHLINPKVAVGDKVVAGQIIGEVGSFGNGDPPGYGAVEIGLLRGGQKPEHVCPFAYLDDSIREAAFAKMRSLFQAWEDYMGDQSLYTDTEIPGCLTLNPIEG